MDFCLLLKIWVKIIGKNISASLSGKYSPGMLAIHHKLLDHAKKSGRDAFKSALKRAIKKASEATGDLISSKISNKIMKVSKSLQQNDSETIKKGNDKEIPKERYISPEEREEIIDELRLK